MNRPSSCLRILLGLIALLASAKPVLALTPAEFTTRKEVIEAAQKAHRDGDHRRALELYQKAAALEVTPSLLYMTIWEQQELGQLAEAYATARQCLSELSRHPEVRNAAQIKTGCEALESQLRDRVGRIVVEVPGQPEGLTVKLAGQALNLAAIGIPYVITPGTVLVEAEAPGHSPFRLEINVPEGKTVNVIVTMAAVSAPAPSCPEGQVRIAGGKCGPANCQLGMEKTADGTHCCWPEQKWEVSAGRCTGTPRCPAGTHASGDVECAQDPAAAQAPAAPPLALEPAPAPAAAAPVLVASAPPPSSYGTAKVVLAATGGALLIAGTVMHFVGNGAFDDLKNTCNGRTGCTQAEYDSGRSKVRTDDALAITGWAAGGACLGIAAILQAISPSRSAEPQHAAFTIDPARHVLSMGWKWQ
jgi:hypothetical protein